MKKNYNQQLRYAIIIFTCLISSTLKAQVPEADFKVCKKVLQQYDVLQFTDLSTYSPLQWNWEVYDSVTYLYDPTNGPIANINSGAIIPDPYSNGKGANAQNPEFQFELPGCYTVKLVSRNTNGYSIPKIKKCYITVLPPFEVFVGFGTYNGMRYNFGKIYDNGGIKNNYTNNQGINTKSYLKILPTNNKNVTLNFKQIKLADSDSIRIYDADTIVSGKLLGVVKNSDNGKLLTFVSTTPKMFFIFNSNSAGNDSGYYAEFHTDYNPFIGLNKTIKTVKNFANQPSIFVNDNNSIFIKNFTREWYVNSVLQPIFADKDTLKYTFFNTNKYNIHLKITPLCDTAFNTYLTNQNSMNVEKINSLKVNLYPNPSNGNLNIDFEKTLTSNALIELMNIEGKTIQSISTIEKLNTINTNEIAKGIYFIKINIDGKQNTYKLICQ